MFDHISLQVTDVPTSRQFYESVLAPLGIVSGHDDGVAVGFFGSNEESFWLSPAERPEDRELHIAFRAPNRQVVREFHQAAVSIDAEILHAPGLFPQYHEDYYGAFVRDPDGHNVEAVCHQPES